MERKTILILSGGNNKKDYWCYWSVPVSTVNTTIKNSGIPANANISRVGMYARADYDGGSLSTKEIYLQFGFGSSTNSISKFLQNDIIIGDDPNGLYPSDNGVDVTGYFNKNTLEFSQSNGAYLVFCVHTDNWSVTEQTFSEAFVVIDYTEHTHSYTTETARTPSTCYTKGSVTKKCSCGTTQTTELALDPNNHAGGTEIRNAKAATCTATGYTGDTYCKGCGAKLSSGSTIAKKAHTEVTIPAVAPTCNTTGLTEGKKCSVCNTIITAQQTIPALGHTINVESNNDSYGTVTGGGHYDCGATATLNATLKTGYKFVKWSDGVTSATRTVTVTADTTYTAIFEVNTEIYRSTKKQIAYKGTKGVGKVAVYKGIKKIYG